MISNIVVTEINMPIEVYTDKSHRFRMEGRKKFGLSFCEKGSIIYKQNGKEYLSDKNHAVILPKNGSYSLRGIEQGVFQVIDFECENYKNENILVLPVNEAKQLVKYTERIKNLLLFNTGRLEVFSIFYKILESVGSCKKGNRAILHPAMEFLENNLSDYTITNTVLAKKAGISEVYFRKLFLKTYGISPRQYILEKRIEKAKQLLLNSSSSVTKVSTECGFSSLYLFCRTFKERTGLTPTEYSGRHSREGI